MRRVWLKSSKVSQRTVPWSFCSTSNHNPWRCPYRNREIVFYLCSTSNHNCRSPRLNPSLLSFISVLHQTTTITTSSVTCSYCLLSLFYIKPQPTAAPLPPWRIVFYLCSTSNHNLHQAFWPCPLLSFISVLHQTTTDEGKVVLEKYCLLSLFYIKPQLMLVCRMLLLNCLLSLFYIKPQLYKNRCSLLCIVFYLCSTSNHNDDLIADRRIKIVFYLCSTSNHNEVLSLRLRRILSFISVLHQTTTYTTHLPHL